MWFHVRVLSYEDEAFEAFLAKTIPVCAGRPVSEGKELISCQAIQPWVQLACKPNVVPSPEHPCPESPK